MKTVIFSDFFDKRLANSDGILIALNPEAEDSFQKAGLKFKSASDYGVSVDMNRGLASAMREWWSKEFEPGRCFKSAFSYYGLSLSWVLGDWLLGTTPYSDSLINTFEFIELIEKVLKVEGPENVILVSNDEKKIEIFGQINGINKTVIKGRRNPGKKSRILMHYCWLGRCLYRMGLPINRDSSSPNFKIVSFVAKRLGYVNEGGLVRLTNAADAVFDAMTDKDGYQFISVGPKYKEDKKIIQHVFLEKYMKLHDIFSSKHEQAYLDGRWKAAKPRLKNIFYYKKFNIWASVEGDMDFFFSTFLFRIILEMRMIRNCLRAENPDLVIHDDAPNIRGMQITAVTRNMKIKNLALQHSGAMMPWVTSLLEKADADQNDALSFPFPDRITVHGGRNKTFLVRESKYRPEMIDITGDPRYDKLSEVTKNFDRNTICQHLGLNANKEIILFAPSTDYSSGEKKIFSEIFFRAAKKAGSQIVVKLHPREKEKGVYENESKIVGRRVIFTDYDISKLIYISDAVVSTFSSVNLEAVLLGRPSIILDPFRLYRKINLFGAVYCACSEGDLNNIFKKIPDKIKNRNISRKRFIHNLYYKLDGKACERIANVIKDMVKGD